MGHDDRPGRIGSAPARRRDASYGGRRQQLGLLRLVGLPGAAMLVLHLGSRGVVLPPVQQTVVLLEPGYGPVRIVALQGDEVLLGEALNGGPTAQLLLQAEEF